MSKIAHTTLAANTLVASEKSGEQVSPTRLRGTVSWSDGFVLMSPHSTGNICLPLANDARVRSMEGKEVEIEVDPLRGVIGLELAPTNAPAEVQSWPQHLAVDSHELHLSGEVSVDVGMPLKPFGMGMFHLHLDGLDARRVSIEALHLSHNGKVVASAALVSATPSATTLHLHARALSMACKRVQQNDVVMLGIVFRIDRGEAQRLRTPQIVAVRDTV